MEHRTPRTSHQCSSKTCNLCLSEKLQIFRVDPKKLLNKILKLQVEDDIEKIGLDKVVSAVSAGEIAL